jgi:hypothetical protein
LLANAAIVVDHSCSLLVPLLAPLLATLGTLLGILGGNVGRCFPVVAQSQARLGYLIADGVLGGDPSPLLGGAL